MELSKAYMLVSLNKYISNSIFCLFFLFLSCSSEPQKQKVLKTAPQTPVKKEVIKTKPLQKKVVKKKLLVNDIINHKNVRSFFTEYGKKNPETKLLLKTRLGNIHITLYKETPLHRASFIYLIKNGYYNKTCFHRIVKDFIIQGGWSEKTIVDSYRIQLNQYRIPAEFRKSAKHKRGSLSATRSWENNPYKQSNPFEFYITQTNVDCSHLNGEHTVFGQVTSGFKVIDKIANVKLDGNSEWPEVDVDIEFIILK